MVVLGIALYSHDAHRWLEDGCPKPCNYHPLCLLELIAVLAQKMTSVTHVCSVVFFEFEWQIDKNVVPAPLDQLVPTKAYSLYIRAQNTHQLLFYVFIVRFEVIKDQNMLCQD
jgi:hypothetical protein